MNTKLDTLYKAVERLKIERDAIIRNASNAEIKYNKQIKELLEERRKIMDEQHG